MLEAMGLPVWGAPPAAAREPAAVPPTTQPTQPARPLPAAPAPQPPFVQAPVQAPEHMAAAAPARAVAPVPQAAAVMPSASPAPPAPPARATIAVPAIQASTPVARTGLSHEAIAQLDWAGLEQQVADCRACGLCESRQRNVFGVGHRQAHWMIVGEAPGAQEDQQGEPFVGAAGQLLDSMLRAVGLSREPGEPQQQVFIANTLKCRPPGNRNPEPAELAQCEPYLQRQIALIQPRIILAMGRFAVQQLLQTQEAIGRLRGRVHRYQGVPLIVTYHPAYLLRNLPDKARAWEDLCLALQTLEAEG
jgi:DNA polymerase